MDRVYCFDDRLGLHCKLVLYTDGRAHFMTPTINILSQTVAGLFSRMEVYFKCGSF